MDNPTEEEIAQILRRESVSVSATLTSISRTAGGVVGGKLDIDVIDHNLSKLVELRAAHETLQARNSVRNSARAAKSTEEIRSIDEPSDFAQARKEIIHKFHQVLRNADAEGERVGTGLHRNRIWVGESGNTLNAAKAAESRTNKVCNLFCRLCRCVDNLAGNN